MKIIQQMQQHPQQQNKNVQNAWFLMNVLYIYIYISGRMTRILMIQSIVFHNVFDFYIMMLLHTHFLKVPNLMPILGCNEFDIYQTNMMQTKVSDSGPCSLVECGIDTPVLMQCRYWK